MDQGWREDQRIIEIESQYAQVGTGNRVDILERPRATLELLQGISCPASVARRRLHFPDEKRDHQVRLLALHSDSNEAIDFNFGCRGDDERQQERYRIDVDVRRKGGYGTEPRKPPRYEWDRRCKLLGVASFWFRFFEPNTEYEITFRLKRRSSPEARREETLQETTIAVLTNSKAKPARKKLRESPRVESSDGNEEGNNKAIVFFQLAPAAPSERSLELTRVSNDVMKRLQRPRDNGSWVEFEAESCVMRSEWHDLDTRLAIMLEESVEKCYRNRPDESKALIEEVLSQVPQAENGRMLAGRAFHYLAGVYRREKNFGEAEKYIELAAQNIPEGEISFDQSCLAYERASVLLTFCRCCRCPPVPRS